MKCDYKSEHPRTEIGEHHFHNDTCCKCGLIRGIEKKVTKKELNKLRKRYW